MRVRSIVWMMFSFFKYNAMSMRISVSSRWNCNMKLASSSIESITAVEDVVYNNILTKCKVLENIPTLFVLSVSGGLDSMALLHILGRLKSQIKLVNVDIHVINFNSSDSGREVLQMKRDATLYNMTFHSRNLVIDNNHSTYGYQENECRKLLNNSLYSHKYLVLGFQADDLPETILLKLLEGCHISKLSPINFVSDCGVKLFPMINVKKQMLIEYMEHLNLDYAKVPLMNDRTSILRSEIIPIMEELAHGKESLRRRFINLAEQSSDAHEILADHRIPNDEVQVSPLLQSNLSIEDRVFDNLINNCGISPTARTILLLSVSGGVDSMALLHIMGRLKLRSKLKNIDVHVINFNHKARVESDEEVYLVQSQANLYNMSFYSREINQSELRHEKPGFQEFARDWRQIQCRDLLNTLSYEQKYTVMGHQEDDQPETILLKLLRGNHISKLYPMHFKSTCGKYLRPLLNISKLQIIQYMEGLNLKWSEDSSNSERKYKRNIIRLDLIPKLESFVGGKETLKRLFNRITVQSLELHDILETKAEQFLESYSNFNYLHTMRTDKILVDVNSFFQLQKLTQSQVISKILDQFKNITVDSKMIKRICELAAIKTTESKSMSIGSNVFATIYANALAFEPVIQHEIAYKIINGVLIMYSTDIAVSFNDTEYLKSAEPDKSQEFNKMVLPCRIQTVKINSVPRSSAIIIRKAREGDNFRSDVYALNKFLRELDIPRHFRREIPVFVFHTIQKPAEQYTMQDITAIYNSSSKCKVFAVPPYINLNNTSYSKKINLKISLLTYL